MLVVAFLVLLTAASVVALLPDEARAHVRATEGTSLIRQDGNSVRIELSVEYDLLAAAAGLGSLPDGEDVEGRKALLSRRHDRLESYLTERVIVSIDGVSCAGRLVRADVARNQRLTYARSTVAYECPGGSSGSYRLRYGIFSDADAVVDAFTIVADYRLNGTGGTFVFDQSHREFEAGRTGFLSAAVRFVAMGVEHILSGLDHVLFLIVLLIGARGVGSVVKVATTFTVAHSVTLALGVFGWVDVPAGIVEPLIALSIAYVAVENILGGESRHRLLVVFGFGLIHGLGFAGTLSFTDGLSPRLLASLLSFNLGIELGQVLIIALVFPLLMFIRRFSWSAIAHTAMTGPVAMISLFWFFQRLMA